MHNPWLAIPEASPHVLLDDEPHIRAFNAKLPAGSRCRIHIDDVIPEPFVGSVKTAPVIVLQLNPGSDQTNIASHAAPDFRAALFSNLRHEATEWPFYFLDPRFRETHPGGRWWSRTTRKLAEVVPLQRLARRLAAVEWFPYKSPRFRRGCSVPSQEYGFFLVSSAIARDALIIVSRSVGLWEQSVPMLQEYNRKLTLSSVQNVVLTPNNVKHDGVKSLKAWRMLVEALS